MRSAQRFVVVLVLIAAAAIVFVSRATGEMAKYQRLNLGLTSESVVRVFGREPDHICDYEGWTIWYFIGRGHHSVETAETFPSRVEQPEDIPYIYDAVQILLDRENTVRAYTWNGETDTIVTVSRDYHGDSLADLPEEFWKEHARAADAPDA